MINKKIAMLGMWGVGKTSLVRQFVDNIFDEKYLSTLGVKVDKKVVDTGQHQVNLILWDIAGAEESFGVPMHYVNGAAAYMLVIDGTRKESLAKAVEIVKDKESERGHIPLVAVVNKSDLPWALDEDEINSALDPLCEVWFSTSAKTGENVEAVFSALAAATIG